MKIINRTTKGIGMLWATIAAFGMRSVEVADQGGMIGMYGAPMRYGNLPSNAAAHKRASRKRRNIRARAKK